MGNPRSSPYLGGPWARKPLTARTLRPSQTVYKPVSQGWRPGCRSRGPEGPGGPAAGRGLEQDPPGVPGLKPGGTRGRSVCPALGLPWDPRRPGGLEGAEVHGTALDMARSGSPSSCTTPTPAPGLGEHEAVRRGGTRPAASFGRPEAPRWEHSNTVPRPPGLSSLAPNPQPRGSTASMGCQTPCQTPCRTPWLLGHLPQLPLHAVRPGGSTDPMGSLIPRGPTSQKGKPRPKPELGGVLPARPPSVIGPLSLLR